MRKHKHILIALIFVLFADVCTIAAPIPPDFKKAVAFIFILNEKKELSPQGTAFFVAIPHPKNDNVAFSYMVTAKHVLQTEDRKAWQQSIYVRLNKLNNESIILQMPIIISGEKKTVYLHPDNTVDIAVIPVRIGAIEGVDVKTVPSNMITTKEDFINLHIEEGSEVFFTGLFYPYVGAQKNYPIVRFGRVSLITNEKIKFVDYEANLYLIETGSYGGNSGSPVYFYLGIDRSLGAVSLGPPIFKLAGVMSGTFRDVQKVEIIETSKIPIAPSSMGIAAVVPAYKLYELLFGDELKTIRERNM